MDNILTVVIVTFNPNYDTLNRCIKSIDNNIEILIIDNAKNLNKSKINNFTDKKIIIKDNENLGNGHGINKGINYSKTKFVLYLDVDTILDKDLIKNLLIYANKIKDFAVLAPSLRGYSYRDQDFKYTKKSNDEYCEMNFLQGAIMLLNKDTITKNQIKFDEKIFLYWEELDFFYQCKKKIQKIYLIKNIYGFHEGGSSINKKEIADIELNRNWHFMWSKFYYYEKNYNKLYALKKTIKHFLSAFVKFSFYKITNNEKKDIYRERLSGLVNSFLGKPSWRRPILK